MTCRRLTLIGLQVGALLANYWQEKRGGDDAVPSGDLSAHPVQVESS